MPRLLLLVTLTLLSTAEAATAVTTSNVTLRRAASVSSAALAVVPRGTQLTMACSGGWCRTTYKGQSGYVSKTYTKALTPTSSILAPALPAQKAPVVYANCSAARAAGAAPIMAGQPGYAPKLDRDRDGVACE
ncbi:excalibur calcium-binding domain-containing protein [Deinococcus hohokamensis]|uniref:Excalibur calcium-binding domain-containing protein n=1 Tax=Deinococcus hohokamensis TaxID=309883 RepID=A0ABV9ICH4_9DEIO